MKKMRLFLIALSLLAGSANMRADIVDFGSDSQTEWNATADDGCDMGSTVTLDGVKVTLGSPDDAGVTWTWHAGNAGLLPSQMPSTDGTAETLITEFSEEAPFGNLPSHGAFLKIEPTKAGTITIRVTVNPRGKVIKATYAGGTGEARNNTKARQSCIEAAMQSQFSVPLNRTTDGVGTITWRFI